MAQDLAEILAPVNTERFFREFHRQRFLYVRGHRDKYQCSI
jgi:hypothetical protein